MTYTQAVHATLMSSAIVAAAAVLDYQLLLIHPLAKPTSARVTGVRVLCPRAAATLTPASVVTSRMLAACPV